MNRMKLDVVAGEGCKATTETISPKPLTLESAAKALGVKYTNTTTKPGVLAELATMRKRFVACAMHNGSDKEFAEGACEPFDGAISAVKRLARAAEHALNATPGADQVNSNITLAAALAAFNGEQS